MRTERQRTGDQAEEAVAATLERAGWTIVGRAVRIGRIELDLVAIDPGPPRTLVVVEVRFRARRDFGMAEESVGRAKMRRLRAGALAIAGLATLPSGLPVPRLPLRVDLVAVEPSELAHGPSDLARRTAAFVMRHHRAVA